MSDSLFNDPDVLLTLVDYTVNVISAFVILITGWLLAGWLSRKIGEKATNSKKLDATLTPLFAKIARIIVMLITVVAVLGRFGIETASIVAVLSVAGLAIGLALQGTLTNVASGVMLLSFRPFEVGDFIMFGNTSAVVDEIGLFVTKMHTLQNIYTIVPNSKIWGNEIQNWSRNETRRVDLVFSISYDDDIDTAFDVIKKAFSEDQRILSDPQPFVAVGELADNSVNILARPWTARTDAWQTGLDLRKLIKQRFDEAGLTIPYPQRDVHMFYPGAKDIEGNGNKETLTKKEN